MKKLFSIVAVLGLSACMGGGGGDDGPTVSPEVLMNQSFETQLNNVRASAPGSLSSLTYDTRLISTAEDYAQADLDGLSPDVGDLAVANGYFWDKIRVASADGNFTTESVLTFWQADFFGEQVVNYDDPMTPAENFGLGKVPNGATERWALVVAVPK